MDAICFLKRNCKDKTSCHTLKLCQETDKCFEEIKVYVKSLEIFWVSYKTNIVFGLFRMKWKIKQNSENIINLDNTVLDQQ